MPSISADERRAVDAYEGAVLTCTEWVRANVEPGSPEWKNIRGMLDCYVRFGINVRADLVSGTGIWAAAEASEDRISIIGHALQKLLAGAWRLAPLGDRHRLLPFIDAARELGRGRRCGTWLIDEALNPASPRHSSWRPST